ncbi:MAG: ral secretion pathway protein [Candidatus Sumerlaeota bacterium]|nr:ral secretion pathway protein [Candidatus Sumerlaeota bacterium]
MKRTRGFTLIETLLALGIAATLLAAAVSVLFGAVRMRSAAAELSEEKGGTHRIASVIRSDLQNAVVPAGLLAGTMLLESDGSEDTAMDTLEFYTASGTLNDSEPWADIRRVEYLLDTESESATGGAYPFIRRETVNLLASTEDDEDTRDTVLLAEATGLSIECFDGEVWSETWDSTVVENENPVLVSLTVTPAEGNSLVFLQHLTTQPRPTATAAAAAPSQQTGDEP